MPTKSSPAHRPSERQSREAPHSGAREATGQTTTNQAHKRVPRLPHERDESADSQVETTAEQRELMRQAKDDVDRGLTDTDKGAVMDQVYRRNFDRE